MTNIESPEAFAARLHPCATPHLCAKDWHSAECPARNRPAIIAALAQRDAAVREEWVAANKVKYELIESQRIKILGLTIAGNALAAALYLHSEHPENDPQLADGDDSALAGWSAANGENAPHDQVGFQKGAE